METDLGPVAKPEVVSGARQVEAGTPNANWVKTTTPAQSRLGRDHVGQPVEAGLKGEEAVKQARHGMRNGWKPKPREIVVALQVQSDGLQGAVQKPDWATECRHVQAAGAGCRCLSRAQPWGGQAGDGNRGLPP